MVTMAQRCHPSHALVNVVTEETNEQNHDRWNSSPEHFQWEVSLQGQAVSELTWATAETHQAENDQTNNAEKQNCSDAEKNSEQLVINGCVGTGVNGQQIDVLADPQSSEDEQHPQHQSDDR